MKEVVEAVERAALALGVVGRWSLTITSGRPGTWSITDGSREIAKFDGLDTTRYGVAQGIVSSMPGTARPTLFGRDPSISFDSVRCPKVAGGGSTLVCVKEPPFDLTGDGLTDALALILHTLPPTEKRCPKCEGARYVPRLTGLAGTSPVEYVRDGWVHCWSCANAIACETCKGCGSLPRPRTGRPGGAASDPPCPDCRGEGTRPGEPTGWVPQSWAEVMLKAVPRDEHYIDSLDGQRDARERLGVLADDLQAKGDPLGDWLALWLAAAKCRPCGGDGRFDCTPYPCLRCHGHGIELGAHQQAIIDALDRLTVSCPTCASEGAAPGPGRVWDSTGRVVDCPRCRGAGRLPASDAGESTAA